MEIILLIAGAFLGGVPSWFISKHFYMKSSSDQDAALTKLEGKLRNPYTLARFEELLMTSDWNHETIKHQQLWICQTDNAFQIELGEYGGEFREEWVSVYPQSVGGRQKIYLKIGQSVIKELLFISVDDGRILVPLPERDFINNKVEFYWDLSSLPLKVCKIIGDYYIYKDIYGVAQKSNVKIISNE